MLKGFYFVTDCVLSRNGIFNDVREAVKAGACAVQYREKNAATATMIQEASKLKILCKKTPFIINDRLDIAMGINADGVHLGQCDMPLSIARKLLGSRKIIGVTVHSLSQAERAVKLKADYLGVSPIFKTATKSDAGEPVGLGLIAEIRKKFKKVPIVAIGGINLLNASKVIVSGADALCAISAVVKRGNVKNIIQRFLKEINSGLALRGML